MTNLYIGLFKKSYTVRRHEAQTIIRGHTASPFRDVILQLNVQPLAPDELMALPEGERTVKRLKSFGPDRLASSDEAEGIPGDRLFYKGRWYECMSSVEWDHTMLGHYRSEFTILPQRAQMPPP